MKHTPFVAVAVAGAVLACTATGLAAQEPRRLAGHVMTRSDSTPLDGVRIRLLQSRLRGATDQNGRFTLEGVPGGTVRLAFERIGVVPDTVLVPPGRLTVTVFLRTRPIMLRPVVTEATPIARERFDRLAQTSTVSLEPEEIEATPTLAEPDPVRTVQLLPGAVAKNDFTIGLNIRGGETDQNLIRLDGITLFNPFHLGGLFSTFDVAAVERVDFITGGFPAGFGGRLSSVMDVDVRSGRRDRTSVTAGLSLLSGKFLIEGPIGNTGASYLVGGRRTYADAFADAFTDDTFLYYFGDALGKVTVPVGQWTVSTLAYVGRDVLDFPFVDPEPGKEGVDFELDWGNRAAGVSIRRLFGGVELRQEFSLSEFSTGLEITSGTLDGDNFARVLSAQTGLAVSPGGGHNLRIGGGVEGYELTLRTEREALEDVITDLAFRPTIWSAYVDDQWEPTDWLFIRPGVRVEHVAGGADFTSVAPRMAFKAFLTDDWAIIGSGGRFYQAIHSIRDSELPVTIFEFWIGADDVTPVARSDQVVLGFERWFGGDEYSVTVEGYDKEFDDLVRQNRADDPAVKGDEFISADGYARGVDVSVRKHRGTITGWLSYGFGKTIRETPEEAFPPAHDRRHQVNLVVQSPGPLGSAMTTRWGFGSPLPFTGIDGQWLHREYNPEFHRFDLFEDEVISTVTNGERFPAYHRLDVSFRWEFEKWGGTWRPYFQVVNVYNRRNPFVFLFDFQESPPTRSGFSQLPLVPTFGVEVTW